MNKKDTKKRIEFLRNISRYATSEERKEFLEEIEALQKKLDILK